MLNSNGRTYEAFALGANPDKDINVCKNLGETPLFLMCKNLGSVERVKFFLAKRQWVEASAVLIMIPKSF